MAGKTAQELFDELNQIEDEGDALAGSINTTTTATTTTTTGDDIGSTATPTSTNADDHLSEIQNMLQRPVTPHLASSATSTRTRSPAKNTPPSSGSNRSSRDAISYAQDEPSGDASARNSAQLERTTGTTVTEQSRTTAVTTTTSSNSSSSWWGGLSAIASAAVKQAEAAVKEIQKNEEAQKWAEQMKGNYGALRGLGDELRSRALPTFSTLLHTIAPPISQHERLKIHITHDLVGYPSLDPLIYQTFSRVMSQVEGGDLMVIQRGSESAQRRASDAGYTGSGNSGWNDGPWWRQNDARRNICAVKGLAEGTRLVKASAQAYANDFFAARGGLEEAAKQATVVLSENNPVRSSDIFLAIQAINHTAPKDYFDDGSSSAAPPTSTESVVDEPLGPDELVCFAVYLHDPIHSITFSTLSPSFPQKWADWLDAAATPSGDHGSSQSPQLPEEIVEMIQSGGVDPREWVSEWMEEVLSLGVGVVAQRYVARRMGFGEGGIRGKSREYLVENGAGEAARAI